MNGSENINKFESYLEKVKELINHSKLIIPNFLYIENNEIKTYEEMFYLICNINSNLLNYIVDQKRLLNDIENKNGIQYLIDENLLLKKSLNDSKLAFSNLITGKEENEITIKNLIGECELLKCKSRPDFNTKLQDLEMKYKNEISYLNDKISNLKLQLSEVEENSKNQKKIINLINEKVTSPTVSSYLNSEENHYRTMDFSNTFKNKIITKGRAPSLANSTYKNEVDDMRSINSINVNNILIVINQIKLIFEIVSQSHLDCLQLNFNEFVNSITSKENKINEITHHIESFNQKFQHLLSILENLDKSNKTNRSEAENNNYKNRGENKSEKNMQCFTEISESFVSEGIQKSCERWRLINYSVSGMPIHEAIFLLQVVCKYRDKVISYIKNLIKLHKIKEIEIENFELNNNEIKDLINSITKFKLSQYSENQVKFENLDKINDKQSYNKNELSPSSSFNHKPLVGVSIKDVLLLNKKSYNSTNTSLNNELKEEGFKVEYLNKKIVGLKNQVEALSENLLKKDNFIISLEGQLRRLNDLINQKDFEIEEQKKNISELEANIVMNLQEKESDQSKIQEEMDSIERNLKFQIENLERSKTILEGKLNVLNEENTHLNQEIVSINQILKASEKENLQYSQQVTSLRIINEQFQAEILEIRKTLEEYKEKFTKNENEKIELINEKQVLENSKEEIESYKITRKNIDLMKQKIIDFVKLFPSIEKIYKSDNLNFENDNLQIVNIFDLAIKEILNQQSFNQILEKCNKELEIANSHIKDTINERNQLVETLIKEKDELHSELEKSKVLVTKLQHEMIYLADISKELLTKLFEESENVLKSGEKLNDISIKAINMTLNQSIKAILKLKESINIFEINEVNLSSKINYLNEELNALNKNKINSSRLLNDSDDITKGYIIEITKLSSENEELREKNFAFLKELEEIKFAIKSIIEENSKTTEQLGLKCKYYEETIFNLKNEKDVKSARICHEYFEKGKLAGREEKIQEINNLIKINYELKDQTKYFKQKNMENEQKYINSKNEILFLAKGLKEEQEKQQKISSELASLTNELKKKQQNKK